MGKDEVSIQADWAGVLKRRNCMEIYEYLYNVILNEDYALDQKFIVRLLKLAKESDLPCEPAPYGNLKQDIERYMKVYSHDAT